MGLLRLLLAVAVIIAHAGPLAGIQSVGGDVAVEAFFMISGFYMALVLNGKYHKGSYTLFISNRLLRLYPVYWVVVLLTMLVSVVCYFRLGMPLKLGPWQQVAGHLSLGSWVGLVAANLFIIGQDVLLFVGVDKQGNWFFTNRYAQSFPPAHQLMMVHQAWSLSVEILFYLLAPFLVRRRSGTLVLVAAASLAVRLALYQLGLYHDPWNYRFFSFRAPVFRGWCAGLPGIPASVPWLCFEKLPTRDFWFDSRLHYFLPVRARRPASAGGLLCLSGRGAALCFPAHQGYQMAE